MGYSCTRRAKCIGKCILKLANQESQVRTTWATWFWRWRCAVTRCRAWRKLLPIRCIAVQKRAVQFTKKLYLPLFLRETADKFARDYAIKKSFRHALHLACDSAPPPPESSCSRSSYQRYLVSELKYAFPNTFRTARARVSRNLNQTKLTWHQSTVFPQSKAAATIYFITRFTAATIRGRPLIEGGVY